MNYEKSPKITRDTVTTFIHKQNIILIIYFYDIVHGTSSTLDNEAILEGLYNKSIYKQELIELCIVNPKLLTEFKKFIDKYSIDKNIYQWAIDDLQASLWLIRKFEQLGIKSPIIYTQQEMITFIEYTLLCRYFRYYRDRETKQLKIEIGNKIEHPDYLDNMSGTREVILSFRKEWTDFQKKLKTQTKWIEPKNKQLIDWIYSYNPKPRTDKFKDKEFEIFFDFFRPYDKDYKGKYAHITVSLMCQSQLYDYDFLLKAKKSWEVTNYRKKNSKTQSNKITITLNRKSKNILEKLSANHIDNENIEIIASKLLNQYLTSSNSDEIMYQLRISDRDNNEQTTQKFQRNKYIEQLEAESDKEFANLYLNKKT